MERIVINCADGSVDDSVDDVLWGSSTSVDEDIVIICYLVIHDEKNE